MRSRPTPHAHADTGESRDRSRFGFAELWWPALLFGALVVVKLVWIVKGAYGPFWMDEVRYREFAEALFAQGWYANTHYPLLYPLTLMPAFLGGDVWRNMLALNSVYSSLLVFPAYLLGRTAMGRLPAALATLVIAALPYHLTYPRQVMSENVYYALLVFTVWLVVRERKRLWTADVGFGLALGALMLARHISLVVVLALAAAWWLRERFPGQADAAAAAEWAQRAPGAAARFGAVVAVGALTYAPWLAMQMTHGASLAEAMGFGISELAEPYPERTLARFVLLALWYVGAYALIAAPFLGMALLSPLVAVREGVASVYTRLVATTGLVGAALFVAVTRHSFNAAYNYPDATRIMGRYIMGLGALLAIVGFATLVRLRTAENGERRWLGGWRVWFLGAVVPTALVYWGWWALIRGGGAVRLVISTEPDAYKVHMIGGAFVVSCAVLYVVTLVMRASRARPVAVASVYAAGIVALLWWGLPAYWDELNEWQDLAVHGRHIARAYEEAEGPFILYVTPEVQEWEPLLSHPSNRWVFWASTRFEKPYAIVHVELGRWRPGHEDKVNLELRVDDASSGVGGTLAGTWEYEGRQFSLVEMSAP